MSEPLLAAIARSARGSAPAIVPRIVSRFEPLPEALFGEDDLTDEASWDEMKLVAPDVDEFTGVARLLRSFGQDTIGGGTRPERGDLDEAIEGDDVHVGRSDEARRAPSAGPRAIAPAKRDAVPGKTIASVAARDADVGAGFAPRVSPAPHAPDEPPQPIVEDAIVGGDADASTPEGATSSDGARASDAAPSAIQHDLPFAEEGHRGDVRAGFATPITSAPLAPDETTEVRHRPENAASVDGSTPEGAASNGGASPAPPVPAREYADDAFVAWSDGARASDAPPSAIQHDLPFAEEGPPLQNGAVRDDASVVGDEVSGAHRGDVHAGFAAPIRPASRVPDGTPEARRRSENAASVDASRPEGATSGIGASFASPVPSREHADDAFVSRSDGARVSDAPSSAAERDLPFAEERRPLQNGAVRDDASVVGDVRAGSASPITPAPPVPERTPEIRRRPENAAAVDASTPEGATSKGGGSPSSPIPSREHADDAFVSRSDGVRVSDAPSFAAERDLPFAEGGPPLQNGAVRDDASIVGDEVSAANRGDVHAGFASPITPASRVPDGTPEVRRRPENAASDAPPSAAERDLPLAEEGRSPQNGAVQDDVSVVGADRTREVRRQSVSAASVEASDASTPEGATSSGGASPSSPVPSREHVDDAFVVRSDGARSAQPPFFAAKRDLPLAAEGRPLQNDAIRDDASVVGNEVGTVQRGDVRAGFASPITPAPSVADGTPEVRRRLENTASEDASVPETATSGIGASPASPSPSREYADVAFDSRSDDARVSGAPPSAMERDLPLVGEGRQPQSDAIQGDASVVGGEGSVAQRSDVRAGFPVTPTPSVPDRTPEVRRRPENQASLDASSPEGVTSSGGASPSSPLPSRAYTDDAFAAWSDGARASDVPSSAMERDLPLAEEGRRFQNDAVQDDASVVGDEVSVAQRSDVRAGFASPVTPMPPVPDRTPEVRRRPENQAFLDASTPEGATSSGGASPSSPVPSREHADDAFVARSDGARAVQPPYFAAERDLPLVEEGSPLQNGAGLAYPITPASRVPDGTPEVRRRAFVARSDDARVSDAPPSVMERDLPLVGEGRPPQNGAVQGDASVVGDEVGAAQRGDVRAGLASPMTPVPSVPGGTPEARRRTDRAFVDARTREAAASRDGERASGAPPSATERGLPLVEEGRPLQNAAVQDDASAVGDEVRAAQRGDVRAGLASPIPPGPQVSDGTREVWRRTENRASVDATTHGAATFSDGASPASPVPSRGPTDDAFVARSNVARSAHASVVGDEVRAAQHGDVRAGFASPVTPAPPRDPYGTPEVRRRPENGASVAASPADEAASRDGARSSGAPLFAGERGLPARNVDVHAGSVSRESPAQRVSDGTPEVRRGTAEPGRLPQSPVTSLAERGRALQDGAVLGDAAMVAEDMIAARDAAVRTGFAPRISPVRRAAEDSPETRRGTERLAPHAMSTPEISASGDGASPAASLSSLGEASPVKGDVISAQHGHADAEFASRPSPAPRASDAGASRVSHAPALEPVVPARPTIVAAAKVRETPQGRTIRIAIDRIEVGPPRAPLPAPLARRAKPSMTLSRYEAGQR